MSNETMSPSMGIPDYSFPPDPRRDDEGYKNITIQCEPLIKEMITKAAELFGEPTKPADMPVRVTELGKELRTCFHNGIAHIRVQSGVGSDEPVLKHQIAHEIVHVLSNKDVRNTVLEEGLCVYFAVKYYGFPPHADDPKQQKYYEAYVAVTKLLERCPDVIKQLREPPRGIDKISAEEIRERCPDCPGDFDRLVSEF